MCYSTNRMCTAPAVVPRAMIVAVPNATADDAVCADDESSASVMCVRPAATHRDADCRIKLQRQRRRVGGASRGCDGYQLRCEEYSTLSSINTVASVLRSLLVATPDATATNALRAEVSRALRRYVHVHRQRTVIPTAGASLRLQWRCVVLAHRRCTALAVVR